MGGEQGIAVKTEQHITFLCFLIWGWATFFFLMLGQRESTNSRSAPGSKNPSYVNVLNYFSQQQRRCKDL